MSNISPSSSSEETRLSMRVMINKHNTKVLFASIDQDLADILLSFLTLPLGVILRLLKHHHHQDSDQPPPIIGSLNSLQTGISNLDTSHFHSESGKLMLLNTRNSLDTECRKLKINVDDTQPIKYFSCEDYECVYCRDRGSMYHARGGRCRRGKRIDRELEVRGLSEEEGGGGGGEVFVVETAAFLVGDGLQLVDEAGSAVRNLEELGVDVAEVDEAEERIITVGFKEIMELFKGSLFSETPLTDLILHQKQMHPYSSTTPKSETFTSSSENADNDTSNAKKIIVKIMLQKSTKKLLFAQSEEDFIDFLFSFLTIPLGQVESLLDSNSSLGSIDNLYKSVRDLHPRNMKNQYTKESLLKPSIAPKFLSKNQIFALTEKDCPRLYYNVHKDHVVEYSPSYFFGAANVTLEDPKGGKNYVKGPGMFMITDDLTVTPLRMFSSLSSLKGMNISLSDVEELEIKIGLEEGLSILKASLTSTAALTNGLGPFLKKG